MGKPISNGIRERVVRAYESGRYTYRELSEVFGIGEATVNRILRRYRQTGSVAPSPHGGGASCVLSGSDVAALLAHVEQHNDWTAAEYAVWLREERGVEVSRSTVDRTLRSQGYTRKKRPYGPKDEPFPGFSSGVMTSPVLSDSGELIALFSWTRPASTRR